jgi:ParB-like chromosome segregation protein Spo0J
MLSVKTKQVRISDLKPYPGNPKTHDLPLLQESLRLNGQYRAIVVRERDMMILAGHGTTEAAREEGWTKILAHLVEVTDDQARQIVLMDNRAPQRGGMDEVALQALLQKTPDLAGTGYVKSDLDRLSARVTLPEPVQEPVKETFEILVALETKVEQVDLLQRLAEEGIRCRILA